MIPPGSDPPAPPTGRECQRCEADGILLVIPKARDATPSLIPIWLCGYCTLLARIDRSVILDPSAHIHQYGGRHIDLARHSVVKFTDECDLNRWLRGMRRVYPLISQFRPFVDLDQLAVRY